MDRVAVIGTAGAGKSHLATRIAQLIGAPSIDRDSLLGPGQNTPEHRSAVERAVSQSRWVFDGTPFYVEDLVYPRADVVVFLDYSRRVCVWRAFRRSLRVEITRHADGPHKPVGLRGWLDPAHPIRWAWSSQPARHRKLARLADDPDLGDATWISLRTPRATEAWLRALE
jgi:hypothetical protein